MKVYISGPITGYPDRNAQEFKSAQEALQRFGHETVNPLDISADHDGPCVGPEVERHDDSSGHRYGCHVRADILAVFDCDAMFMLPGWHQSRGARVEYAVAQALRLQIMNA